VKFHCVLNRRVHACRGPRPFTPVGKDQSSAGRGVLIFFFKDRRGLAHPRVGAALDAGGAEDAYIYRSVWVRGKKAPPPASSLSAAPLKRVAVHFVVLER
jgi:hypothetical protein